MDTQTEIKINPIEYAAKSHNNTILVIGKSDWLYPKNINYDLPIVFMEVSDHFKWREEIENAFEMKHSIHMDYFIIKTKNNIIWLKSTHWGVAKNV